MRNFHIRYVRLVQFEPEPARGENRGEGKVELAVCEAGMETPLGQLNRFLRKDGGHTSCPDRIESLYRMEPASSVAASWKVGAIGLAGRSGGLGTWWGHRVAGLRSCLRASGEGPHVNDCRVIMSESGGEGAKLTIFGMVRSLYFISTSGEIR